MKKQNWQQRLQKRIDTNAKFAGWFADIGSAALTQLKRISLNAKPHGEPEQPKDYDKTLGR